MANQNLEKAIKDFEKVLQESLGKHFFLKLYVAGTSKKSSKAILNIKEFCEKYLEGCYELEVMDIYQQPKSLMDEQVIAAPTLIKKLPLPLKKLIGDMSNVDRIFIALDIKPRKEKENNREGEERKKKKSKSKRLKM